MTPYVGDPEIAVRIDAQAVRTLEAVVVPERAEMVAVRIELGNRIRPAVEDVEVAVRIGGDR